MTLLKNEEKIDFRPIRLEDKSDYEKALSCEPGRGCEYSFANLYLWGRQNMSRIGESVVLFSQFNRRTVYPFPIGGGDKKEVIDAIIRDSQARGIPCRITGVLKEEAELIERLYPNKFRFHHDEGAFDYVYRVEDLAELRGKKYHGKKNHLNRFRQENPDYTAEPIAEDNLSEIKAFLDEWYSGRLNENPNNDFHMESAALNRAIKDYKALGMVGMLIRVKGEVVAFTMASRLSKNVLDVHFEKARADINGAYAVINYEFSGWVRDNMPEIEYLNREEDMGIEGLRKAKQSYRPVYMVEKCWACLLEDGYDY